MEFTELITTEELKCLINFHISKANQLYKNPDLRVKHLKRALELQEKLTNGLEQQEEAVVEDTDDDLRY